jgi:hypothetical protein
VRQVAESVFWQSKLVHEYKNFIEGQLSNQFHLMIFTREEMQRYVSGPAFERLYRDIST